MTYTSHMFIRRRSEIQTMSILVNSFQHVTNMGLQRKISEAQMGDEPVTFRTPVRCSNQLSY